MKFRKRLAPPIDAVQFKGNNYDEIFKFCPDMAKLNVCPVTGMLTMPTENGLMVAGTDDWIIKDNGKFSTHQNEEFAATYEPVDSMLRPTGQ